MLVIFTSSSLFLLTKQRLSVPELRAYKYRCYCMMTFLFLGILAIVILLYDREINRLISKRLRIDNIFAFFLISAYGYCFSSFSSLSIFKQSGDCCTKMKKFLLTVMTLILLTCKLDLVLCLDFILRWSVLYTKWSMTIIRHYVMVAELAFLLCFSTFLFSLKHDLATLKTDLVTNPDLEYFVDF